MTLQSFQSWILEVGYTFWGWVSTATNFWSAFFATSLGALIAFGLERQHRKRERIRQECAKANAVIATLGRMLIVLENFDEVLPRLKDGQPADDSFDVIEGIPTNLPSIVFADLEFLLETSNPNDKCAFVYGRIAHAQATFDTAVSQLLERNQLAREFRANVLSFTRGEDAVESRVTRDNLRNLMMAANAELDIGLPKRIELFKTVIDQLRLALMSRYRRRQFLSLTVKT